MYDLKPAKTMLKSYIPISRFNKGEAGKIIEEVKEDGFKFIVKNNAPECVLITVEYFDYLIGESMRIVNPIQSPEQEKRRQDFITKIRQNVTPPTIHSKNRKKVMDEIGTIDIDKEAVNELRRVSTI